MLHRLSVIADAASKISTAGSKNAIKQLPVYGHLYIVFRDWHLADGKNEEEAVRNKLFSIQKGTS